MNRKKLMFTFIVLLFGIMAFLQVYYPGENEILLMGIE